MLFRWGENDCKHFLCTRCHPKLSAQRYVNECQFTRSLSRDVQTSQTHLSPKGTFLCHQTGKFIASTDYCMNLTPKTSKAEAKNRLSNAIEHDGKLEN